MLNEKLIESALALTGKTMEDMWNSIDNDGDGRITDDSFSIEKFCYYLLSPEFIKNYTEKIDSECDPGWGISNENVIDSFGFAIYEYQLGNEVPLTNLLSKI